MDLPSNGDAADEISARGEAFYSLRDAAGRPGAVYGNLPRSSRTTPKLPRLAVCQFFE